jgi:hypothetical protein
MVLPRLAAIAAIVTGGSLLLFLVLFGLWGANGLGQEASTDPAQLAAFAGRAPVLYALVPLNGVVVHLAALVVILTLSLAIFARRPLLALFGGTLGVLWVFADLVQNLMQYGAFLGYGRSEPTAAIAAVAHGLQDAGHLGGGLWVLSVVIAAPFGLRHRLFGAITAATFVLHPFVVPIVPAWFYLEFVTLPLWFIWTGIAIWSGREVTPRSALAPTPA